MPNILLHIHPKAHLLWHIPKNPPKPNLTPPISRHQQEEDLRENHPYFDTPLFAMGRESRFRDICTIIVNARYKYVDTENLPSGPKSLGKSKYKQLQLVGIKRRYSIYKLNQLYQN